ncbi:methionine ABC transporter ATP-binding protein [Azonexus sp. IMCC34842]|uniref:methionine ABC transporter ATP-binding protein n=1 Tax=Azonexus sp. IMCC34842 TaxID=3420950 RepID=UPI003D0AB922
MIQLDNIVKHYSGAQGPVEALSGIDLGIKPGEIFGIIGRSGAGKSTLIRCINLLERPTGGRVRVAGRELTALDKTELRTARQEIGMIFQHFNLLSSRTVFANVALPLEVAGLARADIETRIAPLLDLVGLSEHRERYPTQLSGGQKQRVGIARALASHPKVLLCDEATSALDPETTRSILALLKDINQRLGLTIVVITHEMQVIKALCDRVAVLDSGRIVEQGEVFSVFTQPEHPVTRTMIRDVLGQDIPPGLLERLSQSHLARGGRLFRFSLTSEETDAPLISQLSRNYHLDINILHGQIDEIQGRPYGSFLVLVEGAAERQEAAWTWARQNGIRVERADVH